MLKVLFQKITSVKISMSFWKSFTGPQLYYTYRNVLQQGSVPAGPYQENMVEVLSSRTMACLRAGLSLCLYISPLIIISLYRRGLFTNTDGPPYLCKVVAVTAGLYYAAYLTRGLGRLQNSSYQRFLSDIESPEFSSAVSQVNSAVKYDYSFNVWPVAFSKKTPGYTSRKTVSVVTSQSDREVGVTTKMLGWVAASTFGRWLIYPGSTSLLNAAIFTALMDGRRKLIEQHGAHRFKLETVEGNHIDSVFIDKRHEGTDNGNILVIVSQGNAAFYEAGCMAAPLHRGYSILGWNHPGFGASTGQPYPDQEHHAMDCVVQFAIEKLDFAVETIVFYSWSIGGYASSWGAANYPECKALILDATFDTIEPLAQNRMPNSMAALTSYTIQKYFDLDVAGWTTKYPGPVLLFRRTADEMISLDSTDIRTNRGNYLLKKMLKHRYPHIITEQSEQVLNRWLGYTGPRKDTYKTQLEVDEDVCIVTLKELHSKCADLPLTEGAELDQTVKSQLTIFLAEKYMNDVESTHNVDLPANMFEMPWTANDFP